MDLRFLLAVFSRQSSCSLTVLASFVCFFSVLTYIFMIDVSLPNTAATKSPRVHEFTTRILENLKPLMEADEEIQNHVMEENGVGEQDERTQGIKLLKTSELLIKLVRLQRRGCGDMGIELCRSHGCRAQFLLSALCHSQVSVSGLRFITSPLQDQPSTV